MALNIQQQQRKETCTFIYRTAMRAVEAGQRYLNGEIDLTEYMTELDICEMYLRHVSATLDDFNEGRLSW